jgi:hypothetical protein
MFPRTTAELVKNTSTVPGDNVREALNNIGSGAPVAITGDYTITDADIGKVFFCDASAGAITIQLPFVATSANIHFTVIRVDNTPANVCGVRAQTGEFIDTVQNRGFNAQFDNGEVHCNGVTWWTEATFHATTTMVLTGTDTIRAVTPDALAALWETGPAAVVSGAAMTLGEGGYINVSSGAGGSITSILFNTFAAGRTAAVYNNVAYTLVHSGNLVLPGNANIAIASGDTYDVVAVTASISRVKNLTRAAGRPLISFIRTIVTASATHTLNASTTLVDIEAMGGGGAGGGVIGATTRSNGGGGGGAGSRSLRRVTAVGFGASQSVTIGAGGSGVSGAAGGAGGDTSVGSLCIGKGGGGGFLSDSAGGGSGSGGNGGVAGTGDFTPTGARGANGWANSTTGVFAHGGNGASTLYGGGGASAPAGGGVAAAGGTGGLYGSGGGGASVAVNASNAAGGNGAAGVVIITEWLG